MEKTPNNGNKSHNKRRSNKSRGRGRGHPISTQKSGQQKSNGGSNNNRAGKKMLVLHGSRQAGQLLLGRMDKLRKTLLRECNGLQLVAPDGLFDHPDDPNLRQWWDRRNNRYTGLETSIQVLQDIWEKERKSSGGGFCGILGFSQGARLTHLIALLQQTAMEQRLPKERIPFQGLQFVVLVAGYDAPLPDNWPETLQACGLDVTVAAPSTSIHIPSLHIWGATDTLVTPADSQTVMSQYDNPRGHEHDGGHHVPMKATSIRAYTDFVDEQNKHIEKKLDTNVMHSGSEAAIPNTNIPTPMEDSDDDEAPMLVALVDEGAGNDATMTSNSSGAPQPDQLPPSESKLKDDLSDLPPCPVTILSGFLGSGKTTLIQYILSSNEHKKRIAVIENEFAAGDLGEGLAIETLIAKNGVDNSSLTDLIELPNGCVCCTVKDSLVETLETLINKRRDLDYIIIEASGMANPGPIASVFWLDDELESRLRLDGVVTLVDAYHIEKQLKETLEASQQIAYADRILLNKTDLVEESHKKDLLGLLGRMNPAAKVETSTFSKVTDLDFILDAKCYGSDQKTKDLEATVEVLAARLATTTMTEDDNHKHSHSHDHGHDNHDCPQCQTMAEDEKHHHSHSHDHGHGHEHDNHDCSQCKKDLEEKEHTHTSAVSTVAFTEKGTMDLEKLNAWLATTLWPNQDEKDEVLRSRLEKSLEENTDADAPKRYGGDAIVDDGQQQIFRIKGIVSVRCNQDKVEEKDWEYCDPETGISSRRYIIQAVYDLWECYSSREDFGADEDLACKLVVIGRHLHQAELLEGFRSCLIEKEVLLSDEETEQAQRDEVEALMAIYPDEVTVLSKHSLDEETGEASFEFPISYRIALRPEDEDSPGGHWPKRPLSLEIKYPHNYPSDAALPHIKLDHDNNVMEFPSANVAACMRAIEEAAEAERGMPCVLSCLYAAKEFLDSGEEVKTIAENDATGEVGKMSIDEEEIGKETMQAADSPVLKQVSPDEIKRCNLEGLAIAESLLGRTPKTDGPSTDDSGDLSSSPLLSGKGGSWLYTIGLVGKPSAGKSTFFNTASGFARQRDDADNILGGATMAPHPFTTIDPNIGFCLVPAPKGTCPEEDLDKASLSALNVGSSHGRDNLGRRLLPVLLKDVAGLVPGAYQGRGRGNKFLNDLTDATVLVHVVDASGTADAEGNVVGEEEDGDSARTKSKPQPLEDLSWIRNELLEWVYNNLLHKWDSISRRGRLKLSGMFSGYGQTSAVISDVMYAVEKHMENSQHMDHALDRLQEWDAGDVHRLVSAFLGVRFPMALALNKYDIPSAAKHVQAIQDGLPLHGAHVGVPLSARSEMSFVRFQMLKQADMTETPNKAESTDMEIPSGTWKCLQSAMSLREPILVFPVNDMTSYQPLPGMAKHAVGDPSLPSAGMIACLSGAGGSMPSLWDPNQKLYTLENTNAGSTTKANKQSCALRDVLIMKPGSTVEDVFLSLKRLGALGGDFVRAEGAGKIGEPSKQIKKDALVGRGCRILKIMTTKRTQWQQQHAQVSKATGKS